MEFIVTEITAFRGEIMTKIRNSGMLMCSADSGKSGEKDIKG